MAEPSIVQYVQSKGISVKQASGFEIHFACPFCGEEPNKRGRLYLNTDPNAPVKGLFTCFICGARGGLRTLQKHWGDEVDRDERQEHSYRTQQVFQAAALYYNDRLKSQEEVLEWLHVDRGLTDETIEYFLFGWADGNLRQYLSQKGFSAAEIASTGLTDQSGRDTWSGLLTIPYSVSGNVVTIRAKEIGGKYFSLSGSKVRLYGTDHLWHAESVCITEGELDCAVLWQHDYAAVGVPGANVWQDSWKDYFHGVHRVYCILDNDAAGQAGTQKILKSLGPAARPVTMPEAQVGEAKNDPTEWLVVKGHTKAEFDQLLAKSRSSLLLTVDDAYEEWDTMQGVSGLKLGIEALDKKIAPGLLPTQVMVVLAKTGQGKTVLLLNLFHRILLGNPEATILFVSLEQTRSEWYDRARKIHQFYDLSADGKAVLDFFRPRFMLVDKNRITETELVACIQEFADEMGRKPDLVAVDYLGYWARSYRGEAYERTTAAIMAMKAIAKDNRVAFLAPHQVSRGKAQFGERFEMDAARESGAIEETADFVLPLWAEDARADRVGQPKTGRITMRLGKSRHGGVGTEFQLQFAPCCLAMVPVGDPLMERAKDDLRMEDLGFDFERAVNAHLHGDPELLIPRHYSNVRKAEI